MPLNTLLPAFNEDILGGGPEDLGILMSAMGMGAIGGSLMLAWIGEIRHKAAWLIGTCLAWGLFHLSAFGLAVAVPVAAVLVAFIGFISAWNMSLNRGLAADAGGASHARPDHEYRHDVARAHAARRDPDLADRRGLRCGGGAGLRRH